MIFGFIAAGLVLIALSFKNGESERTGKYRTTIGEKGVVILDTPKQGPTFGFGNLTAG